MAMRPVLAGGFGESRMVTAMVTFVFGAPDGAPRQQKFHHDRRMELDVAPE
jgi:hypothetical protein